MDKKNLIKRLAIPMIVIWSLAVQWIYAQEVLDVLPVEGRNELFHTYLMEELDSLMDKRQLKVEESLTTVDNLKARQVQLKEDYMKLLGTFPEKTPLNPVVTGTIERDGYNIDKIYYESRPSFHVTAHLYYPTTGPGPFPGIIVTCGHYPVAKSIDLYQDLCILLAQNGFVTLIVDPICQGERNQIINPVTGSLYYTNESGTKAHSRLDVGAVIAGTSVVAYELWDNHRSVDYLLTRPEVDTSKIGCTGSSGGGAQATYLVAMDNRIKVAAVNSYIMNEQTLYSTIGPQTGSQNLSYEGIYGIDHPDYITMFAPKPFMILAATQDFFDIGATRQTYADAQKVYEKLGAPEKIGFFEYDDTHGYSKPKREAAVKWFRIWFYDDTTTISEPEHVILSTDTLLVTETGQVQTNFTDEKNVTDFNIELANSYASDREAFWTTNTKDSCLNMVKSLIRLDENYNTPFFESGELIDRGSSSVEKIKISDGNHTPVTGLFITPDPEHLSGGLPTVLYVDGRGKKTDAAAGGLIEKVYIDSGKAVFAVDVRGFGETTDNPAMNESKHGNNEHRNSVISLYTGKTLIGQRVEDILKAMDYLLTRDDVDPDRISIVGIDRAGTAVLHAAAIDSRFSDVVIRNADSSWMDVIENPTILNNMTHVVPSSMIYYDLPDLVDAIAPRKVVYNPPDYIISALERFNDAVTRSSVHLQNYPNPFQDRTSIQFFMNESGHVALTIYDELGMKVRTLINEVQGAGPHCISFQAASIKPGIYFCQMVIDRKKQIVTKMTVLD
jgi:cephalosporin-C deacetylase-like acetyl esterase